MTPAETTATIAAVSTPPGEGAIALVRLSGPQAIAVADAIFRGKQKPSDAASHFQQFGEIVEEERVHRSGDAFGPSRAGELHRRRRRGNQLPRRRAGHGASLGDLPARGRARGAPG